MIAIATGGRHFAKRDYLYSVLDEIHEKLPITYGIHGGCEIFDQETEEWKYSGADWLFHDWCVDNDVNVHVEPGKPYFKKFGKKGGHLRNQRMTQIAINELELTPEHKRIRCIAFEGRAGTRNMIDNAESANIKTIETWERWK